MLSIVQLVNTVLTEAFGFLLLPFRGFSPVWAMLVVSCITGLLMLWIFKLVSNQTAIKNVKDRIKGNLLAVRLYQHDFGIVLKSEGRILRHTMTYMKHSLRPMAVMIVPVVLVIVQLNLWFSVEKLAVGESILLKVKVREPASLESVARLQVPEGVEVETPPVRIPSENEISWRIGGISQGRYTVNVVVGDGSVEKELVVGPSWGPVSAVRTGKGMLRSLLYPAEKYIPPESPVESVELTYSALPLTVLGWNIHWLVLFFVLSIGFGFLLKGAFGIEV